MLVRFPHTESLLVQNVVLQYVPQREDIVVGVITAVFGENYKVSTSVVRSIQSSFTLCRSIYGAVEKAIYQQQHLQMQLVRIGQTLTLGLSYSVASVKLTKTTMSF